MASWNSSSQMWWPKIHLQTPEMPENNRKQNLIIVQFYHMSQLTKMSTTTSQQKLINRGHSTNVQTCAIISNQSKAIIIKLL